ncbi:MAG: thermonuclease family protein [Acidilobaceae archaeon]
MINPVVTRSLSLALFVLLLFVQASIAVTSFDAAAEVVRVIDGDTLEVLILESRVEGVLANSIERVRFADINAPELGTPEGDVSKLYLESLLPRGARIYLDIDNVRVRDRYGRVVAVVYHRVNDTCLLNVNAHMVRAGHATVWDHDNEFDPSTWRECVDFVLESESVIPSISRFQVFLAIVVPAITVALVAMIAMRRRRRRTRSPPSLRSARRRGPYGEQSES